MEDLFNIKHYILVNNKRYPYSFRVVNKEITHFVCEAARIDQEFLSADIPNLIADLGNLILDEQAFQKKQSETLRFRVSKEDKVKIQQKALKAGFNNISAFLRHLALN